MYGRNALVKWLKWLRNTVEFNVLHFSHYFNYTSVFLTKANSPVYVFSYFDVSYLILIILMKIFILRKSRYFDASFNLNFNNQSRNISFP